MRTHAHTPQPSLPPIIMFHSELGLPIVLHSFVRPFPKHAVSQFSLYLHAPLMPLLAPQSGALSRLAFRDFHPSKKWSKVDKNIHGATATMRCM